MRFIKKKSNEEVVSYDGSSRHYRRNIDYRRQTLSELSGMRDIANPKE